MKAKSHFAIKLLLLLETLFHLSENSQSIDPQYEACKPFQCGELNITYPFYYPHIQPSFCGLQGFKVTCNTQNQSIIKLSGDDYIINNFWYEDLAINITHAAFSTPVFGCPASIHNLDLDDDGGRFIFSNSNHKDVVLLQNCSRRPTTSYKDYKEIHCESVNGHADNFWVVYREDIEKGEFVCGTEVTVPYMETNESISDIEEILRRGLVLKYEALNCSICENSGGRCGWNDTNSRPVCFCPDLPHKLHCHKEISNEIYKESKPKATGRLGLVFGIGFSLVGILGLLAWYCLRMNKNRRVNLNVKNFLKSYGLLAPKKYTFSDLRKMTNSFKEKIGKGGFGVVYKGKTPNGRLVAVKLLDQLKGDGEDFINEVASMSTTNHVNVVTLLGFCIEGHKRALIYEFLVNGSLDKFTKDGINGQSLTWDTTFQIALGIARGLEYLHRGCNTRILHFDIKPHNILLDENFRPKISDFGLAKLHPHDKQSGISMSMARGTIGYIAPEVSCRNFGEVSHKSDVYSYGMMILEVIGSRRRMNIEGENLSSDLYFPDWIYKQLERSDEQDFDGIMDDEEKELKRKMILVSLWCIQTVPSSRPSMSRVVQMLEASVETLEMPPMPSLASPPRTQSDPSWSSSTMTMR